MGIQSHSTTDDQRLRRELSSNKSTGKTTSAANGHLVWLKELAQRSFRVGYGSLGMNGQLGYENRQIEINGEQRVHSLSAHAPSIMKYDLGGQFERFHCQVAINDDVQPDSSAADFAVIVDGQLRGIAKNVRSHQVLRSIEVDVRGSQQLELVCIHHRWDYCHTIWVDPSLISPSTPIQKQVLIDSLCRMEIHIPTDMPESDLCFVTTGSVGFGNWIDDLFGSICANAQCPTASMAIFSIGDSDEIRQVAEKYHAQVIPCFPLKTMSVAAKAAMYSAGQVIRSQRLICLDADMLVLDDLRSIVAAIDAAPAGSILACRERFWAADVGTAISTMYGGTRAELNRLVTGSGEVESRYPLIVNDGIFAGTAPAIRALDDIIRGLHEAPAWMDNPIANVPWRNQFLFNLAIAQGNLGIELDARYNVQLQADRIESELKDSRPAATAHGGPAAIIHFNGASRHYYPELRSRYRAIGRPLTPRSFSNEGFDSFLTALRRWIGHIGVDALTWSFYGTADGSSARHPDAMTFPLFAALHYLIRSNGCSRVIETGTARGVSAACIASAVALHPEAAVVTIDIHCHPDREKLWNDLPASFRRCIAPRQYDAIEGLRLALSAGENYHAALLDTVHTAEHVLREFELARQLVCPGGLILIHDAILRNGTVGDALNAIQREGYGVTRLWTADDGHTEDDRLGLAVIENRKRSLN